MKSKHFWLYIIIICGLLGALHKESTALDLQELGEILKQSGTIQWLPIISDLTTGETPISTRFQDAMTEIPFMDSFQPKVNEFVSINCLPRSSDGAYLLTPGLYALDARSYCLQAGTYGPSRGDGYLYAPLKGSKANIVQKILTRSIEYPGISQQNIQVLLWAIVARTRFSEMSFFEQQIASVLLTPQELLELSDGVLGLIPDQVWQSLRGRLPGEVLAIYETENQLRQLLTTTHSTYAELERIAVLSGVAPEKHKIRDVPHGRWSYHPAGYFIRYFPDGYQKTRVEVYVPRSIRIERDNTERIVTIDEKKYRIASRSNNNIFPFQASEKDTEKKEKILVFHPAEGVAMPANTSSQRLAIAPGPYETPSECPPIVSSDLLQEDSARLPLKERPKTSEPQQSQSPQNQPQDQQHGSGQDDFLVEKPYQLGPGFCTPHYDGGNVHTGIDIIKPANSPVYALCDGQVKQNWTSPAKLSQKYSNVFSQYKNAFLIVAHECGDERVYGYYGHIRSRLEDGTKFQAGDLLGYIREAFDSRYLRSPAQDHLHFGISSTLRQEEWGLAQGGTSCATLKESGWQDPLELLWKVRMKSKRF